MGITRYSSPQAWTKDIDVVPPNSGAGPLFDLYDSQGDMTIAANAVIPTTADGPMTVAHYRRLEVNAELTTLTASPGLIVLCDELVIGGAGKLHMSGKAPRIYTNDDPRYPFEDIVMPQKVSVAAKNISPGEFRQWLRSSHAFIGDKGYWRSPKHGLDDLIVTIPPGGVPLVKASGCGVGGAPYPFTGSGSWYANNGVAGADAPGGGCGGGVSNANISSSGNSGRGAQATPYGGGLGGGSGRTLGTVFQFQGFEACYSGIPGRGYDDSGNARPGGDLFIICRGPVTIAAGGKIAADADNITTYAGPPGGGRVVLIHKGPLTNNGSITAAGGKTSVGAWTGGAGAVTILPFASLGW